MVSIKKSVYAALTLGVVLILGSFVYISPRAAAPSPELAVSELSPSGETGGRVVPASCSSYEHYSGECSPPSFSSSQSTVVVGRQATLTWACQNSSSSSSSNFSTGGAPNGSTAVTPSTSTTYTLVCSNGGSGSVTVSVINPSLSITAAPSRVRSGSSATITWASTLTNSCTVTGPGVSRTGTSGSAGTGPIVYQSTYTISCQTDGGAVSSSVVVNVAPQFEEI